MRSRLEDLIATAERQLASGSFDAAIDSYRTALSEPGAAEAGVAALLESACRARDEARGVVRPPDRSVLPTIPEVASEEVAPEEVAPEEVAPEEVAPVAEAIAWPEPKPEPVPLPVADEGLIEAPSFHLIEDDPSMLERPDRRQYPMEVEKVSILDPTPASGEPDPMMVPRIAVAGLIAAVVCLMVYLLK